MKSAILLFGLTVFAFNGNAQTLQSVTDNGSTTSNPISINTGTDGLSLIGNSYLSFKNSANLSRAGYIQHDGSNLVISADVGNVGFTNNVGIGTSSPGNYKLNVMGPISGGVNNYTYNAAVPQLTNESKVDGISGVSPTGAFRWYTNPNNSYYAGFLYQLRVYDSMNGESGDLLTINGSGNVGIGTATPNSKLAVNGNIRAQEIKVETANWPDFVFAKSYQLPTLPETEKHIKEKGHLPGIPSAAEVKANGIDLGEMNAKLLQKIEELTLHLIEQNKIIKDQKEQEAIQESINRANKITSEFQQKQINELKALLKEIANK